jgi:hypothetical protein
MSEQLSNNSINNPNLPSGFLTVEQYPHEAVLTEVVLPWIARGQETRVAIAECSLQNGQTFLLASAIGSHPKLVEAANAMTQQQSEIANNMFYSRIQTYLDQGHAPNIETMPEVGTNFPIKVMRNKGGQRVYFGLARVTLSDGSEDMPVVLKLGSCDKNKQGLVTSVLSSLGSRTNKLRNSRGSN